MDGFRLATGDVALLLGALAGVVTLVFHLRTFVRGLSGFRTTATVRRAATAGSVGMAAIFGGALALASGGPAAIPWMWIGTLGCAALAFLEVFTTVRRGNAAATRSPRNLLGLLVMVHGIVLVLFAVFVAVLQSGQAAAALEAVTGVDLLLASLVIAGLCAPLVLLPGLDRSRVHALAPGALVVYLLGLAFVIGTAETPPSDHIRTMLAAFPAFEPSAGIGGLFGAALPYGVMRAVLVTEGGLSLDGQRWVRPCKLGWLCGSPGPLRRIHFFERFHEGVPSEAGAFDADRRLTHSLERFDISEDRAGPVRIEAGVL